MFVSMCACMYVCMYESITYVYMHVRKYVCMYMEFIENILRAFQKPSEYIFQKYLNK